MVDAKRARSTELGSRSFILRAVAWGAVTSAVVIAAALVGGRLSEQSESGQGIDSLAHWDGLHFKEIIELGYHGDLVVFFPAYPLAAGGAAAIARVSAVWGLVIVSNAFLLGSFGMLAFYLRSRRPALAVGESVAAEGVWIADVYALLALGLWPTTFFFRMAYTESLFLFLALWAMLGICRGWRLVGVALIVGLATAARPVGVALLLPLAWYAWTTARTRGAAVGRVIVALIVGAWGAAAYMLYLKLKGFGPLSFVVNQAHWSHRPEVALGDKLLKLLSGEPLWNVYAPGETNSAGLDLDAVLTLLNPLYFLAAVGLVWLGGWKRWLSGYELLLSIALLAIPYFTRAYEMRMASQGRFAAVVFPMYIVLGQLLARAPRPVAILALVVSGAVLVLYAALFGAGYVLI